MMGGGKGSNGKRRSVAAKGVASARDALGTRRRGSEPRGRTTNRSAMMSGYGQVSDKKGENNGKKPLSTGERDMFEVKQRVEELERDCKAQHARIDMLLLELEKAKQQGADAEEMRAATDVEMNKVRAATDVETNKVREALKKMEDAKWEVDVRRIEAEGSIKRMKAEISCAQERTEQERVRATHAEAERDHMREEYVIASEERITANEEREQVIMLNNDQQGKFFLTAKANIEAQGMMREATLRDKAREEEFKVMRKEHAQAISESVVALEETRLHVNVIERKVAAERKGFEERQRMYKEKIAVLERERAVDRFRISELIETLDKPAPTLEQIRDEVKKSIDFMASAISERISETDEFRGGETLRWKMIRAKMETVSLQVSRIFDVLTPEIYRRDVALKEYAAAVETEQEAHAATKDQVRYVSYERKMLRKLFHPEPNLYLKDARLAKYTNNNGKSKSTNLPGRVVEMPVPMRARLLLSEVKSDKVAEIIERNRTWTDSCSTLLLSCCAVCGAFFLDSDMVWPCACASSNAYSMEHQEYTLFHDDQGLQDNVRENMLLSQCGAHLNVKKKSPIVRSTVSMLPPAR